MKKILAALLALMMVVACVATLASCGKAVPADYEDAKKALEDAEYMVSGYDKDAEVKSRPGVEAYISAYKAIEGEGDEDDTYVGVYVFYCENSDMAKIIYKEYKLQLEQYVEELELDIEKYELILEKYADDFTDEQKEDYEDKLEDMKKELETYKDDYVVGKKGTIVWYGNKEAVEVAAAK